MPEGDPDPNPDPGANNEALPPRQPKKSFWEIFWKQVRDGKGYLCRWRTLVPLTLAVILLSIQVCSLGTICTQERKFTVLVYAFGYQPLQYTGLLIANTLTIAGIMDMFEGCASVARGVGMRRAQREAQREEPDVIDLEEEPTWRRVVAFPRAYATEFATAFVATFKDSYKTRDDFCENVVEPFLMLTLTFALRWVWDSGKWDSATQMVIVSMVLHLVKWLCDAIVIFYDLPQDSWLRPQKHLFILVLLLLGLFAVGKKRDSISFNPMEDLNAARWFNNARTSEQEPMGRVRIEHLPVGRPQQEGRVIHRVTNTVVTKWVEPTRGV